MTADAIESARGPEAIDKARCTLFSIASKLGIQTEIADVLKQSAIDIGKIPPEFAGKYGPVLAVGTGLALKEQITEVKLKVA